MSLNLYITVYTGRPGKRRGHSVRMGRPPAGDGTMHLHQKVLDLFPKVAGLQGAVDRGDPTEIDLGKMKKAFAKRGDKIVSSTSNVSLKNALEELRGVCERSPDDAIAFAHLAY